MASIYDVAAKAGVSPATVSRVINHDRYVKPETRARVQKALKDLNYVPNTNASSLTKRRTHTIALVIPDITNPFFTTIARGVEDKANQNGLTVVLCNTDENLDKEQRYMKALLEKRIDGIVLAPVGKNGDHLKLISQHDVPVVLLDRQIPGFSAPCVKSDNVSGAQALTAHLISVGHRRIAIATGPPHVSVSQERLDGYRRALEAAGIAFDEKLVRYTDFKQDGGRKAMSELLDIEPRPTAVLAGNNFVAIGALLSIRERGLTVPKDIALACFDDIETASTIYPFLTVLAQPAYTMGTIAGELLLQIMNGKHHDEANDVILQPKMIVRQSCGALLGRSR